MRKKKDLGSVLKPWKTVTQESWEKAVYGAQKQAARGGGKVKFKPKENKVRKMIPLMCMLSEDVMDNEGQRHALIETMNNQQMNTISKYMRDFLEQKSKVPKKVLEKLKEDKDFIYHLANRKNSVKSKKEVLKQKGGFLPVLAATAAAPFINVLAKSIIEPLTHLGKHKAVHRPALPPPPPPPPMYYPYPPPPPAAPIPPAAAAKPAAATHA